MPSTININAKDLNAKAVEAIQKLFGDADLEISARSKSSDLVELSEDECWTFIDSLDWDHEDVNNDLIIAPLLNRLSKSSIANIYQFADWLSEKLWNLDTRNHARVFIEDDSYLSVDDFLYARCAVVASGKAFYYQVLETPSDFPIEVTFEPLLYLPQETYHRKTGEKMVYVPPFNYETYGNKKGWGKEN